MASLEYLAQPSGPCCLKGNIHEGEPRGKLQTIAGLETYVVTPSPDTKNNGNVVFFFPDVWGLFTNGMLVMDAFAEAGYTVLAPDYFQSESMLFHDI